MKDYTNKAIEILSKYAVKVDKETCPKLLQELENLTSLTWYNGTTPTEFNPVIYLPGCLVSLGKGKALAWDRISKLPSTYEISFSEFMKKLGSDIPDQDLADPIILHNTKLSTLPDRNSVALQLLNSLLRSDRHFTASESITYVFNLADKFIEKSLS